MDIKHLVYALLAALIPLAFSLITGALPSFPLDEKSFGALILWLVGLIFGGWQWSKTAYLAKGTLSDYGSPFTAKPRTMTVISWKNIVFALLSTLLPIVYGLITGKFPDFPISAEGFIGFVLWLIGLLIGGWQLSKSHYVSANRLYTGK